jgi:hypothetical protein
MFEKPDRRRVTTEGKFPRSGTENLLRTTVNNQKDSNVAVNYQNGAQHQRTP